MLTRFNQDKKIIFLDPHTELLVSDEKLHIILSPSLYWVKKVILPLKHAREAKKLLESLFEDVLPEGNYSYSVYKASEEGEFFIFAYEDKSILDLLTKQGISSSNIGSVHFAQSELYNLQGAMKINETQSIYVKDGIVTLVPCCWIQESGMLSIEDTQLSKHKIILTQFGHIVDSSSLIKISAILGLFILLIWVELFILKQDIQKIQAQSSELFIKYKLKPTIFQNKALLKKYTKIHTNQTKLRMNFSKELKKKNIQKISYKNNKLKVIL